MLVRSQHQFRVFAQQTQNRSPVRLFYRFKKVGFRIFYAPRLWTSLVVVRPKGVRHQRRKRKSRKQQKEGKKQSFFHTTTILLSDVFVQEAALRLSSLFQGRGLGNIENFTRPEVYNPLFSSRPTRRHTLRQFLPGVSFCFGFRGNGKSGRNTARQPILDGSFKKPTIFSVQIPRVASQLVNGHKICGQRRACRAQREFRYIVYQSRLCKAEYRLQIQLCRYRGNLSGSFAAP